MFLGWPSPKIAQLNMMVHVSELKQEKTFDSLLLLNGWMDFEIISHACYLRDSLPKLLPPPPFCCQAPATPVFHMPIQQQATMRSYSCQVPCPSPTPTLKSPKPMILYKPACHCLCQAPQPLFQGLYNTVLKPPVCHLKTFIFNKF